MEALIITSMKINMITKHRVSNVILMRGEMDTAPPPLRLREEENTAQNRTEAGYRNRTNIRVVFDAHCHPCLSTQRQMSKTIKRITAVSPLLLRCWHLRSTGESADYPLDCPHPPPSKVAPHPSPDIRGRRMRTIRLIANW